jgi:hypothetical protein
MKNHPFAPLPPSVAAVLFEAVVSNAFVRFASVVALGLGMTSCVPAKNYDEARSAAETEFAAHARTRSRLEAAHERIRTLETTLAERDRAVESGESNAAQAKLETVVATKDKDAAVELVEELRSELARTGTHLVAYSDEKRDLTRALLLAEQRVRDIEAAEKNIAELVAAARDTSIALGPTLAESGVDIGARDGQVIVGVPTKKLFAEGSDALVVDAAPVLAAVGKVSAEHSRIRIVLHAPDQAPLTEARLSRLGAALRDRGVPETRLVLPSKPERPEEPKAAPVATDAAPTAKEASPDASEATETPAVAPAPAPASPIRFEIGFAI